MLVICAYGWQFTGELPQDQSGFEVCPENKERLDALMGHFSRHPCRFCEPAMQNNMARLVGNALCHSCDTAAKMMLRISAADAAVLAL